MAQISWTRMTSDGAVKRVIRDESFGEELAREEIEVVVDGLNLRLVVEVLH